MRRLLLLLVAIMLSACSGLSERIAPAEPLLKPPASAKEAVEIARDMAKRGRWSEAITYLDSAKLNFPGDDAIVRGRERLQAEKEREARAIEDRILIGDAENLQRKIELLDQLAAASPHDLFFKSRKLYWKEKLVSRHEMLIRCAEVNVADKPMLAKRCFDVASQLPADASAETRLATVDDQLKTIESVTVQRRKDREHNERQARAAVLINNAKASIERQDFRGALVTLDKVARLQPDNSEATALREQAENIINPQIEALVKLGDHLYLDEQLNAAVATWRAALSLNPSDDEILARIERAETVLDKLQTLRQQQNPIITKPAP